MKLKISLIVIFVIFLFAWFFTTSQKQIENLYYAQASTSPQKRAIVIPDTKNKIDIEIESEAAMVMEINSIKKRIIFQKNIDKGLPIASLSKLMTAVIVLENYPDLSAETTISLRSANQSNVSSAGNLFANSRKTIKKLMDLMLIYSSNDSAFALSEIMGEEKFVQKMNEKAEEIGLKNTKFVNPNGLDPEDNTTPNYSTARDLTTLTQYIIENHPIIFDITLKKSAYKVHDSLTSLYFSNNQELIGGKTGYTIDAGGCLLVVFKDKQGRTFINVILGSSSPKKRIEEMQKLIDQNI